MSNPFTEMGFTDPTLEMMRQSISKLGHNDQAQYFGTMMVASLASRVIGMMGQNNNTTKEILHRDDLKTIKDEYSKNNFEFQISDIIATHKQMLKNEIEFAKIQFSNMKAMDSYKIFLSTWCAKFKLTPDVFFNMLENKNNYNNGLKPIILIPRTEFIDSISGNYTKFCEIFAEKFQHSMTQVDFSCRTIWKYNSQNICSSPKCDSFILHFILQGLPTIIVYPVLKKDKLIFYLATWPSTISQNFFYKKVYEVTNNESIDANNVADIIAVITAYTADCYSSFYANDPALSLHQLKSCNIAENAEKLLNDYHDKFSDAHKLFSNLGVISNPLN